MHQYHVKLLASGFALLSVSLACMSSTWAAQPVNLRHESPSFLRSLSADSSLKQISSSVDANKTVHVRFQQTYKNYVVFAADGVMHIPNGTQGTNTLTSAMQNTNNTMNGIIYNNLNADLVATPSYVFSSAQADKALQQVTQAYQKNTSTKSSITNSQSKLMVYVDKNNKAHWAFLVSFDAQSASAMPVKPIYIVDGVNFSVYQQWDNIQTLENEEGGGFGGNEKTGKFVYDSLKGDFSELDIERDGAAQLCYLENADVTVKDRRKNDAIVQFVCSKQDDQHNKVYWDADSDAVNGAFSPSNDALYAGKVIKEMYQKWYGVSVLTTQEGKPMMLSMRVHENMENAYWDGKEMTFGDGASMFYPLVSLGVAAHEISHGFTQQHSGLIYSGQSGGLNESFSDMAAQAAEFYSVGKNSWQIGPEIFKAKDEALRYMDEPTKDGRSISNVKDYQDWLDVHYTSGIFNKFFYRLGTAKNWDTKKAFDVMVQANAHYWTSGTTFQEAYCGVMSAAKDHKYDTDAVFAAGSDVGLDAAKC